MKKLVLALAIAALAGPAWGQSREAAYEECRTPGVSAVAYVKCRIAAERRYGHPLREMPDLVRLEQATRLVLAERFDNGTLSAAEYDLEYQQLKADTFARYQARLDAKYGRLSQHLEAAAAHQRMLADEPIPVVPPNPRPNCVGTEFGGVSTLSCR